MYLFVLVLRVFMNFVKKIMVCISACTFLSIVLFCECAIHIFTTCLTDKHNRSFSLRVQGPFGGKIKFSLSGNHESVEIELT